MSRWLLTVLFTIVTSIGLFAQQNRLEIKGTGTNLYLDHTVAPQESFYSLGRMYNVAPKDLASYNKVPLEGGLSVGQNLKIPLDKSNFTQSEVKSVLDFLIPVYHQVESGETLYRLGVNYNKVSMESLKKWNSLPSDAVNVGSSMIIGFLKVDKNQSPLATTHVQMSDVAKATPVPEQKQSQVEVIKPITKTEEKTEQKEAVVTERQVVTTAPQATVTPAASNRSIGENVGFFRDMYDQQIATDRALNASGTGGVFKSTSGWQDGKFYCFNNEAAPGSILKVTNNSTGKFIYAKVLDAIPDIKQNFSLIVIVSNAAADVLGAGEGRFECVVEYMK